MRSLLLYVLASLLHHTSRYLSSLLTSVIGIGIGNANIHKTSYALCIATAHVSTHIDIPLLNHAIRSSRQQRRQLSVAGQTR